MSSDDADFAAYLTARWPVLVRSLVLLGDDGPAAEAAARDGLVRCRADWERVRRADDVDSHVYRAVLDRRRPAAPRVLTAMSEEDVELLRDVDERLQGLGAGRRSALVLGVVGGLDAPQVADVVDVPLAAVVRRTADGAAVVDPATLRRAAEAIAVPAVPVEAVLAEARARRRRRLRLLAVGVLGAVAVAAATWAVVRDTTGDSALPPARVTRAPNPVDVAWYADGVLHLDRVRVEVPSLTDLAEINGGVVYADDDGVVAFVAADGRRRLLGHKVPDTPLVASADEGWAAWLEPGSGSRLVAYDVSAGAEIFTYDGGDTEIRPVAIDLDRIFFDTPDDSFGWDPGPSPPEPLGKAGLVDSESATRVFQVGPQVEMEQGFFSVSFTRPGVGALLSPGGTFLLTRPDGAEPGAAFRPLLYDTRTGKRMPLGLGPDERVLDATFGDNYRVVYLVAPDPGAAADALLVLRTCDLDIAICSDVTPVAQSEQRPLLAH